MNLLISMEGSRSQQESQPPHDAATRQEVRTGEVIMTKGKMSNWMSKNESIFELIGMGTLEMEVLCKSCQTGRNVSYWPRNDQFSEDGSDTDLLVPHATELPRNVGLGAKSGAFSLSHALPGAKAYEDGLRNGLTRNLEPESTVDGENTREPVTNSKDDDSREGSKKTHSMFGDASGDSSPCVDESIVDTFLSASEFLNLTVKQAWL